MSSFQCSCRAPLRASCQEEIARRSSFRSARHSIIDDVLHRSPLATRPPFKMLKVHGVADDEKLRDSLLTFMMSHHRVIMDVPPTGSIALGTPVRYFRSASCLICCSSVSTAAASTMAIIVSSTDCPSLLFSSLLFSSLLFSSLLFSSLLAFASFASFASFGF